MNIKKLLKGLPDYQVKNENGKLTYPKTDGVIALKAGALWSGIDPSYGVDETIYQNVCLWYDHTLKIMKGHDVRHCKWKFDGQFWIHSKLPKVYDLTKGEQPITGIEITGVNKVTEIEVGND